MKAVVFHGIGDIRLEDVPEPTLREPTDAIVRLTASAICGTDLHFVRGTLSDVKEGRILGHEGVGVIEALGSDVRNLSVGDRVVIPSTIACGACAYCRAGYTAQCDVANPHGQLAGTAFYGGPEENGGFDGLQAEKARVPFAHVNLIKLPDEVTDDQAILLSDIVPTGYFGADLAGIKPGHTVAVFGAGPVGQFVIASAKMMQAGRIFAIDHLADRLDMARAQGAEVINFEREDPVQALRRLTGGIGVDCAIDAVGVDAQHADHGPARPDEKTAQTFAAERHATAPQARGTGAVSDANENAPWQAGDAPSQVLRWAVEGLAKAGILSIIGVYPPTDTTFPIGVAMNKNLTVRMGNCNHRRYLPKLVELVRTGALNPAAVLSVREPMAAALDAYRAFDTREPGWMKVKLDPQAADGAHATHA